MQRPETTKSTDKQSAHNWGAELPDCRLTVYCKQNFLKQKNKMEEEFSNWLCLWVIKSSGEQGTPINMFLKEKKKKAAASL